MKPIKTESVQCLYFSPTGSTRKIVETVAAGSGLRQLSSIDITTPIQRQLWSGEIEGDLLLVGVPVYGGIPPALVLEPLAQLNGKGVWAVPIAVCGNVRMGTCLAELCAVLRKQGFTIAAAGNFIAQHSFACNEFSMGRGRPDQEDLREASKFGADVVDRVNRSVPDITSIYGDQLYIQMYVSGRLDAQGFASFPQPLRDAIRVSDHDDERCDACGKCVEACPTGSIDERTYRINDETCIRCFACTVVCPNGVKQKVVCPPENLATWFTHQEEERGRSLLFI